VENYEKYKKYVGDYNELCSKLKQIRVKSASI